MSISTFNFKRGYTHAGVFHADDVFSSALLQLLNNDIVIERGYNPPDDDDVIVFDIGGGEFDHHQADNEVRDNGIPYASFGKLWRAFGMELMLSESGWEFIEEKLVEEIDYTDTTGKTNPLSMSISSFNPRWNSNSDSTSDIRFWEAVDFAKNILQNLINDQNSLIEAEKEIEKSYKKYGEEELIILDRFVPVQSYASEIPKVKFSIFPSDRGGWNILSIKEHGENRCSFPDGWLGNPNEKIGMTFCHPGNFMASTVTKEAAINVAKIAILYNDILSSTEDLKYQKELKEKLLAALKAAAIQ